MGSEMVGVMNAESGVPYCSLLLWARGFSLNRWSEQGLFVDYYKRKRAFFLLVKGERTPLFTTPGPGKA